MSKSGLFIVLLIFTLGQMDLQAQSQSLSAALDTLSNLTEIQFPVEDKPREILISNPVIFSDNDVMIGQVSAIAADGNGGIYIADRDQFTIHRFDENGTYISSIGRDGEGPGEFRSLVQIVSDGESLYTLDSNLNRITIFDPETGDPVETLSTGESGLSMPETFYLLPNDAFLIIFQMFAAGSSVDVTHYKPAGILTREGTYQTADQIKLPARQSVILNREDGNIGIIVPPYSRNSGVSVSDNGSVYTNWSEHLLIKEYDSEGLYSGSYYSDLKRDPLTRSQLRNRLSNAYMNAIRGETLPSTWPAVKSFTVDNRNRLWVNLFGNGEGDQEWIVIQKNGELDGMLVLPEDRKIQEIQDSYIYLIETDSYGIEVVKRYEFD